ncbi:hypothetical protein FF1_006941 [Malus domestica]
MDSWTTVVRIVIALKGVGSMNLIHPYGVWLQAGKSVLGAAFLRRDYLNSYGESGGNTEGKFESLPIEGIQDLKVFSPPAFVSLVTTRLGVVIETGTSFQAYMYRRQRLRTTWLKKGGSKYEMVS